MQHIEHLSRLLHDHVHVPSSRPLPRTVIDGFFQSIATDRIHVTRLDWQGHPVATMLWHMPNLRPERLTALVAYITHQWDTYSVDIPEPLSDAAVGAEPSPVPAAMRVPAADIPSTQTGNNAMTDTANHRNDFFKTLPTPRRDWFDRFTDWVAAVISLFE